MVSFQKTCFFCRFYFGEIEKWTFINVHFSFVKNRFEKKIKNQNLLNIHKTIILYIYYTKMYLKR